MFTPVRFVALEIGYLVVRRNPLQTAIRAEHNAKVVREHAERGARMGG